MIFIVYNGLRIKNRFNVFYTLLYLVLIFVKQFKIKFYERYY
jgi:hypothetical protein